MRIPPFTLDHWLATYEFASPPIRYNLASSTGPRWTLGDLLALGDGAACRDSAICSFPMRRRREARRCASKWPRCTTSIPTGSSLPPVRRRHLSALYCLAAEPGASITLPFPSFPAMPVMARAWGLERFDVRARSRERLQAIRRARARARPARRTRLVLVNTPHNPTGSVMPQAEIARLAANLEQRLIPLVVDEVYHPLYHGASAPPSAAKLPNTIVVGDLSKALSLPGSAHRLADRSRCAPARAADRSAQLLHDFRLAADRGDRRARARESRVDPRAAARRRRDQSRRARDFMSAHEDTFGWVAPAGGTTVFPWLRDGSDARELCATLAARAGVLLAPGDCFDAPEHFRLGFGAQAEGFAQALDIVSETLRAAARRSVLLLERGASEPLAVDDVDAAGDDDECAGEHAQARRRVPTAASRTACPRPAPCIRAVRPPAAARAGTLR